MGVEGSGKSTVGSRLAAQLGVEFVDADSEHSPEAVAQMAAGIPLTEAQREPWLDRCHEVLAAHATPDEGIVLACSALTIAARRRLAGALPVRFVALIASEEVLAARVAAREGHFAGPELLASQLATLELDPEVVTVDAGRPVDDVVAEIRHVLGR